MGTNGCPRNPIKTASQSLLTFIKNFKKASANLAGYE
jgi:hypothetical protein